MCDNTATWNMFTRGPGNMLSFGFVPYTYACDEHKDAMSNIFDAQIIKPEHIITDITCNFDSYTEELR